jgi:signal transduction histidine kinase
VLEGYGRGAVDYLHKPVNPAILQSKVAIFANLHHKNLESMAANRALVAEVIERRRAEDLLQEANQKLRDSVEELQMFSYGIAHDLRAPLRAMESYSGVILTDHSAEIPDPARRYLQRITKAAKAMGMFITDILGYSQLVHGDFEMRSHDVEELIHEIVALNPALDSASADIVIERPLPRLSANKAALTQVVSNLLSNAVKFVPAGVRPRIRVWGAEAGDGMVQLWFEDNGIGISPQSQARLFKIFVRLNGPERYEGTGIGLAIVRKAVERMGGSAGVESEEGKGSRFWVRLAKG